MSFGRIDLFITCSGNFGDRGAVDIAGGNDVVLYTMSEPASVDIGCLGLAFILRSRRVWLGRSYLGGSVGRTASMIDPGIDLAKEERNFRGDNSSA
ncbi:MAG: hypothetical protein EOP83_20910 [Verrucomicrobiaceae bacterium]|nr:MAG: hypothetical protein EOP83_20910 [Verrucomicrobiaceae bacterium]